MDPAAIVKLLLIGGIGLNVISIGVRARPGDALALVRQPALAARAMLAMFVLVPAFVLLLTSLLDLSRPVTAVLLALSVAPMPPLISNKELKAGGDPEYAIGLQILATAFSLVALPIMLTFVSIVFGQQFPFEPTAMVTVLASTVAIPMAIGMALSHFMPGWRASIGKWAGFVGMGAIAIGAVALLVARGASIIDAVGDGGLLAAVAIVIFALAAGHLLGGPDEGSRSALAMTCAARHPGVTISVVSGLLPQDAEAILGMTGLYFLVSLVLTIPYLKWRAKALPRAA